MLMASPTAISRLSTEPRAAAVALLGDGSAAAAFLGGAIPTGVDHPGGDLRQDVIFLPFDPDKPASELLASTIRSSPPPRYRPEPIRGRRRTFVGLNVGSMQLITAAVAGTDEDLVYSSDPKILCTSNGKQVVEKSSRPARAINPVNAARDTGTPVPCRARSRFYREIGIWPGRPREPATAAEVTGDSGRLS